MKNLIHKYIGWWFIPFYKRKIAPSFKLWYDKFIDWRYGIKHGCYMTNKSITNMEEWNNRQEQYNKHRKNRRKFNQNVFRITGIGTEDCKLELKDNIKKIDYEGENNKGKI